MSGTRDVRAVTEKTSQRAPSRTGSRTTGSSSPVVINHYDFPTSSSSQRRPSDDWEDLASDLSPSDSASRARAELDNRRFPGQREHRPRTRQDSSGRSIPPPAPEPVAAQRNTSQRRPSRGSEESRHRGDREYRRQHSHDSGRGSSYREEQLYAYREPYDDEIMYDRRGPMSRRPRYTEDRYSYDDYERPRRYSPPVSHVSPYDPYPPAQVVRYQQTYPPAYYPHQYHPSMHSMSPPLTEASGHSTAYFPPPMMYQYAQSPPSTSSRSPHSPRKDNGSESFNLIQEQLKKHEDHMKLMREQLETEAATRLARDNQREEEFKREKAAHQASLAQEAALKQRAEDLAAAEKAGKLKAEADAAKKADEAEKKAKKDKEKYEKDAEEWKKSEATLKAAKEEAKKEADALRPSPDDALAPVKFTDARGRSWMFPWRYCKQWKTMEILITKCYHDSEESLRLVERGLYWLYDPEGHAIIPGEIWDHTVQPGWEVRHVLFDTPKPKPKESAPPPLPARHTSRSERDREKGRDKKKSSSSRPSRLKSSPPPPPATTLPSRSKSKRSTGRRHDESEQSPPLPPSPPDRLPSDASDDPDEILQVIDEAPEAPSQVEKPRRKKSSKEKEVEVPIFARWLVGSTGSRARRKS